MYDLYSTQKTHIILFKFPHSNPASIAFHICRKYNGLKTDFPQNYIHTNVATMLNIGQDAF